MSPTEIRALSGAVDKGVGLVLETIFRAEINADAEVKKQCQDMRGHLLDFMHDCLEGGLGPIADRREACEDPPHILAAQTRNDMNRSLADA